MRFRQFLADERVSNDPEVETKGAAEALRIFKTHCSDAMWMLEEDSPIYRGEKSPSMIRSVIHSGYGVIDTAATARKSQNTANYYTVILDNHPDRQHFPKRSRSLVCSRERNYASDFSFDGMRTTFVVVPFNGTKIGMVNSSDMWDTEVRMFGETHDIVYWNSVFESMKLAETWEAFKEADALLKRGDAELLSRFDKTFGGDVEKYRTRFMEEILDAYSAEKTRHTCVTTATMPHESWGEVWVGGKVLMMTQGEWYKLKMAQK